MSTTEVAGASALNAPPLMSLPLLLGVINGGNWDDDDDDVDDDDDDDPAVGSASAVGLFPSVGSVSVVSGAGAAAF